MCDFLNCVIQSAQCPSGQMGNKSLGTHSKETDFNEGIHVQGTVGSPPIGFIVEFLVYPLYCYVYTCINTNTLQPRSGNVGAGAKLSGLKPGASRVAVLSFPFYFILFHFFVIYF